VDSWQLVYQVCENPACVNPEHLYTLDDIREKICNSCGVSFPNTGEYFYRNNNRLETTCKTCIRQRSSDWTRNNRERANEQAKRWAANNPDKRRAIVARYEATHKEQKRARGRAYTVSGRARAWQAKRRAEKRDKINAYFREWYNRNTDRFRAIQLHYRRRRPQVAKAKHARYRARLHSAEGFHTPADIVAQYEAQHGKCWYCGIELNNVYHADHFIPLNKGGSNWPSNIVCACGRCNCRKKDLLPDEYLAILSQERQELGGLV
jgi:5-methylcytosine-specific restriction endonuclease McrA